MHRDEETEEWSGEDVEGEGSDEEMKSRKGALTLSEGRVVENGFVYEDLTNGQTLAWRESDESLSLVLMLLAARFHFLAGDLLTIPIVAKVFTTIQNVNRIRLLRMATCALALDTTGASSISSLFNFPSESMLSNSVLVELPPSLLPSADSPGSRSRFFNSVFFSESLRELSIATGTGAVK